MGRKMPEMTDLTSALFPKSRTKSNANDTRPTVLMVLTRSLGGEPQAGRLRTLARIHTVLNSFAEVRTLEVHSLLEEKKYLTFLRLVFFHFLRRSNGLPIQCLLFAHSSQINQVMVAIREQEPDVLYLDTIRCAPFAMALRKAFPELRIVSDFDDLMSRRCAALRSLGRGFTLGYLARYLPGFVLKMCQSPAFSGFILKREEHSLRTAEALIASLSDSVTLVSTVDAREFQASLPPDTPCDVVVAPPPFAAIRPVSIPQQPLRFIFIGSDSLLQNRITIEWLCRIWGEFDYTVPLHIYGKQSGNYPSHPSVIFEGYAESLDCVYTSNSILLAPSFVSGGVKTKVAEALSHGIIALGNNLTFEGLGIENNPLLFSDPFLATVPSVATQHLESWTSAAQFVQGIFESEFGFDSYQQAWSRAIIPSRQNT